MKLDVESLAAQTYGTTVNLERVMRNIAERCVLERFMQQMLTTATPKETREQFYKYMQALTSAEPGAHMQQSFVEILQKNGLPTEPMGAEEQMERAMLRRAHETLGDSIAVTREDILRMLEALTADIQDDPDTPIEQQFNIAFHILGETIKAAVVDLFRKKGLLPATERWEWFNAPKEIQFILMAMSLTTEKVVELLRIMPNPSR